MKQETKKHLIYCSILVLLLLISFTNYYSDKVPFHEIVSSYIPLSDFLKTSVYKYNDFWPLWHPYGFSGEPNFEKPTIDLLNFQGILTLIIPNTVIAVKIAYFLALIVAAIAMYSFIIYLGYKPEYALISGIVYAFSGHVFKLMTFTWLTTLTGYAFIPLIFLFGTKAIKEKSWIRYSMLTGILFAIQARANPDMKVTLWTILYFGIYYAFYLTEDKPKKIFLIPIVVIAGLILPYILKIGNIAIYIVMWLILALIIYFVLSRMESNINKRLLKISLISLIIVIVFSGLMFQRILPIAGYIGKTSRGVTPWEQASGRQLSYKDVFPRLIDPLNFPEIRATPAPGKTSDHMGIVAALLAVIAVYKKRTNRIVLYSLTGIIVVIILTSNTFNSYYYLWKYVPFFSSARYLDRHLFMFTFFGALLAGIGASVLFEELLKLSDRKKKYFTYGTAALIFINLGIFGYTPYPGPFDTWRNFDKVAENNEILQYIAKQPGIFRIQTWETHGIDWGTNYFNNRLELEHIYSFDSLWYVPYFNIYLSVANSNPAKLWGILNVKYLTSIDPLNVSGFKFVQKFKDCTAETCYQTEDANKRNLQKAYGPYLYENTEFLPRAYFVDNAVLVIGDSDSELQLAYTLITSSEFNPKNTVIISKIGRLDPNEDLSKYKAIVLGRGSIDNNNIQQLNFYVNHGGILLPNIISGENSLAIENITKMLSGFKGELNAIEDSDVIMHDFDNREIKVNGRKGWLVYSEKFALFNGWQAKADSNDIKIYNANKIISAVYLTSPVKNIRFTYYVKSFVIGSYIFIVTLLFLTTFFSWNIYNKIKLKKGRQ